jgi:hypothetical protein
VKTRKPELAAVVGRERFLAEIRTTANLTHPHILPLHDLNHASLVGDRFARIPSALGRLLGR